MVRVNDIVEFIHDDNSNISAIKELFPISGTKGVVIGLFENDYAILFLPETITNRTMDAISRRYNNAKGILIYKSFENKYFKVIGHKSVLHVGDEVRLLSDKDHFEVDLYRIYKINKLQYGLAEIQNTFTDETARVGEWAIIKEDDLLKNSNKGIHRRSDLKINDDNKLELEEGLFINYEN